MDCSGTKARICGNDGSVDLREGMQRKKIKSMAPDGAICVFDDDAGK